MTSAPIRRLGRLRRDRRGAVAMMIALLLLPLLLAVGAALDIWRTVQFRARLQGMADAAAIAGATVYIDSSSASAATVTATRYMTTLTTGLSPAPSAKVTLGQISSGGEVTAYTVSVAASATLSTTLMALVTGPQGVSVTATAKNPVVMISLSLGRFNSDAWDANTVYWYKVPADNSVPPDSALMPFYSNVQSVNPGLTMRIAASQRIGFALRNVTSGRQSYGANGYGAAVGSVHTFYSHLNPPNILGYPRIANNCSLEVTPVTGSSSPSPVAGKCWSTTSSYAAPVCSQMLGQTLQFMWNDMGGRPDDLDYYDAVFSLSCAPVGGATGVTLLN